MLNKKLFDISLATKLKNVAVLDEMVNSLNVENIHNK